MFGTLVSVLLLLACRAIGPGAESSDPCASKIPERLKEALKQRYQEYNLPRLSDNLAEDIDYNRKHGGDGCLGVAAEDFDADGRRDYAVLLFSPKTEHTLLITAMATEERWRFEQLREWRGQRFRLYVAVASPGTYRRSESFDLPPSEPGELEVYQSTLSGVVTGRTEASGIYYFWTPRGWVHVWAVN